MISSWMRKRAARRENKEQHRIENEDMELTIPNHFRCPISLDLIKDPVTLSTGITYDRESIEKWIEAGNSTCPVTNQVLRNLEPIPNHTIRKMIQDWCVDNKSYGIERIPTPRIPISLIEVSEFQTKITNAWQNEDQAGCIVSVAKLKALAKESERNKKLIVANGTCNVLSEAFEGFSKGSSFDENAIVLEEILSTLMILSPPTLDVEAKSHLGSTSSMSCLVWFLKSGDLSRKRNAVLALKEVVSSDKRKVEAFTKIDGSVESLFGLIKEPICPTATKASLTIIYQMVTDTKSKTIISTFVNMGLVSLLIEMLVNADRSVCEKVLGILDKICGTEQGKEMAYRQALTVPVLVKKILRVSDLATEFSISILWKLSKSDDENTKRESVLVESLQVGAFQKLLLVLQVGCGTVRTKEKVSDLLKMLNHYRSKLECIDSMDLKNLKRPFN